MLLTQRGKRTVKPDTQIRRRCLKKNKTGETTSRCPRHPKARSDLTEQTSITADDHSEATISACKDPPQADSTASAAPEPACKRPKIRRGDARTAQVETLRLEGFTKEEAPVDFRLYKDRELSMLSNPVMNVEMREPAVDFDCPTDNEQAQSAARTMDQQIADALKEFQTDRSSVVNLEKYCEQKEGQEDS